MKVEVYYFEGCPNHRLTMERVCEVEVRDQAAADAVDFHGSPTVRINGLDVEPGIEPVSVSGLCCRTYQENGRRAGSPSVDSIRRAVVSKLVRRGEEDRA